MSQEGGMGEEMLVPRPRTGLPVSVRHAKHVLCVYV